MLDCQGELHANRGAGHSRSPQTKPMGRGNGDYGAEGQQDLRQGIIAGVVGDVQLPPTLEINLGDGGTWWQLLTH